MRKLAVLLAVVAIALLIVVPVAAGDPDVRWVVKGTKIFYGPDLQSDSKKVDETGSFNVRYLGNEWAVWDTDCSFCYLRVQDLLVEEPEDLRVAREKVEMEILATKPMSEITAEEYFRLQQWLASQASAPPTAPPAVSSSTSVTHTVVAGESLSLIAPKHGVTWKELASANGIVSPWTIEIGQVLTIPATGATPIASAPTVSVASVTTTVAGWPTTAQEFLALATQGQPTPPTDGSWLPIELGEIHRAPKEPNSWAVTREKDKNGNIIPFWVRNFTGRAQDGYCDFDGDGKYSTGTPASAGMCQGVTFR